MSGFFYGRMTATAEYATLVRARMKPKLVLFDIDGTLIKSGDKKLRKRFDYAFETVYGVAHQVRWDQHEGAIDRQLIVEEMLFAGVPEARILERLNDAYEAEYNYFAEHVDRKLYASYELPFVRDLLQSLWERSYLGVLTGNYHQLGWLKLEILGLKQFFPFGLFGNEAEKRTDLAAQAIPRAKAHFGVHFAPRDIIIIGDTKRDIDCARAIGARVIATATGHVPWDILQAAAPDLAVHNLSDERILPFILES